MPSFRPAQNTLIDPLEVHVGNLADAWRATFETAQARTALKSLAAFLSERLGAGAEIYPRLPLRALDYVQPDSTQVVILGQDPYHGPNQAQGLAFSVPENCPCPPSLRNMVKELSMEYPGSPALLKQHDLSPWAAQGVLLLNAVLTVESGKPASHAGKGWEVITDEIIKSVARSPQPKVFMLWGSQAQAKQRLLPPDARHLVLTANHPSPLSAQRPPKPFIGCGHFKQANDWLAKQGRPPIDWFAAIHGVPEGTPARVPAAESGPAQKALW